jgi:hypothetical protein
VAQEHTRNYTSTSRQQIIRVVTAQGVVYRGLTGVRPFLCKTEKTDAALQNFRSGFQ